MRNNVLIHFVWFCLYFLKCESSFLFPRSIFLDCDEYSVTNIGLDCELFLEWNFLSNETLILPEYGELKLVYSVIDNHNELVGSGIITSDKFYQSYNLINYIPLNEFLISRSGTSILQITANFTYNYPSYSEKVLTSQVELFTIPGWLTLFPPLFTIILSIVTRQVIPSLLIGIFIGAMFRYSYNPIIGITKALDYYLPKSLGYIDRASIIFFTLLLGGMIGIITKSDALNSVARNIAKYATTAVKGQLVTWLLGLFIFFDDYSNVLIVGSSMSPVTENIFVSQQKLAFIIDATAAPLCSIAPVSSWIGFEVALIADVFKKLEIQQDPYITFLETIIWRFYPIVMLLFIPLNILIQKELGPMLDYQTRVLHKKIAYEISEKEETTKREEKKKLIILESDEESDQLSHSSVEYLLRKPVRPITAILPLVFTVLGVILAMILHGYYNVKDDDAIPNNIPSIFSHTDSFSSLILGSFIGTLVALILVLVQKLQTLSQAMEAWNSGMKDMLPAVIILWFAWTLGDVIGDLKAGYYIVSNLKGSLDPRIIPFIIVCISSFLSFCTGTSWGVMVILFPLGVPLIYALAPNDHDLLIGTIASILSSSVFGAHCSPISDTTILSALSTGSGLVEHVKTQVPYALLVGISTSIFGTLATSFHLYPHFVGVFVSLLFCISILILFGVKPSETGEKSLFLTLCFKLRRKEYFRDPESTPLL